MAAWWGFGKRRGLRPWIISILARSPRNGAEIMDEMENMSMGWWRPSPGSVYPMLDDMTKEGIITKRPDGKYELTTKAKQETEWPFGAGFGSPRTVDQMLNEMNSYVSYFEDLSATSKSELQTESEKIRSIAQRLLRLVE
ncbi:MAG: PadR family transcriptional regulator [Nitrososphaerota archaeon]|nr:PadR family transcriptional regulator [Nitrososphaerota archaeon]